MTVSWVLQTVNQLISRSLYNSRKERERKKKTVVVEKFLPHVTLIAVHTTDFKWQHRGCHLPFVAPFNFMSPKMEFHFTQAAITSDKALPGTKPIHIYRFASPEAQSITAIQPLLCVFFLYHGELLEGILYSFTRLTRSMMSSPGVRCFSSIAVLLCRLGETWTG